MYYPTQDAGKSTLHGLARSISPWKRGENFQFFTKEKVLNSHALKNKGGPAWDIFHGCTKELVIDTCLCLFHSHIINPRQILHFFYSHVHITNKWAYQPRKVHCYLYHWASPQHQCLYSSSQALCFPRPTKSLSIHMHVPSSSLVSQEHFPCFLVSLASFHSLYSCKFIVALNLA